MKKGQSLTSLSAKLLKAIEEEITEFAPSLVIVQGDTNTAFTGALAAFYGKCRIAHIEAGLRTFDNQNPFPEEMNRKLIGQLADFHFTPTANASKHLLDEGIPKTRIIQSGNTIIDAVNLALSIMQENRPEGLNHITEVLGNEKEKYILATIHRRENQGQNLENICKAIFEIREKTNHPVILPVHPNPQISSTIRKILGDQHQIILTDPLPYPEFLWLLKNCKLIISDSGGIQEEATALGKEVILVRETSERMEAVDHGFVHIAGTKTERIVEMAMQILARGSDRELKNIFGDGNSAERIVQVIKQQLLDS